MSIEPADLESPDELPAVGDFLTELLELAGDRWKPVAVLALVLGLPAMGLIFSSQLIVFGVVDEAGNSATAGQIVALVVALAALVLGYLFYLAVAHQAIAGLRLRRGGRADVLGGELVSTPSWRDSMRVVRARAGPILVAALLPGFGVVMAIAVPVLLWVNGVALPFGLVLLAVAGVFWVWVKGSFIVVAGLGDRNPVEILQASASVSTDRFWPVCWRLVLVVLCTWVVSAVFGTVPAVFLAVLPRLVGFELVALLALAQLVVQVTLVASGQAILFGRISGGLRPPPG